MKDFFKKLIEHVAKQLKGKKFRTPTHVILIFDRLEDIESDEPKFIFKDSADTEHILINSDVDNLIEIK